MNKFQIKCFSGDNEIKTLYLEHENLTFSCNLLYGQEIKENNFTFHFNSINDTDNNLLGSFYNQLTEIMNGVSDFQLSIQLQDILTDNYFYILNKTPIDQVNYTIKLRGDTDFSEGPPMDSNLIENDSLQIINMLILRWQ